MVMDVLWQPDLFSGGGEVTVDTEFRTGWRTALDARSWVEVFPGWLAGANELFQRLAEGVPWQEHHRWLFRQQFLKPRLTAEYRQLADAPHPGLVAAGDALWCATTISGSTSTAEARTAPAGIATDSPAAGPSASCPSSRWGPRAVSSSSRAPAVPVSLSIRRPATWWSWAVGARTSGSTRCPRHRTHWAHGSASTSRVPSRRAARGPTRSHPD